MALPEFLKQVESSLIFDGKGELKVYLPETYFKPDGTFKYAEIVGENINTIGFFNYEVLDEKGKSIYGVKTFYFPCIVSLVPDYIEKIKNISIGDYDACDYKIAHFKKGDTVIENINCAQDISNVEIMFKIFMITGRIPNSVPYDKLHEYLQSSVNYNGASFGVNMQLFGIIVSELCRNKSNLKIPFRLAKTNNMHDYKSISIKLVPKFISPFTAITSENWDEAVVNAIEDSKHENKVDSPMERILMD